MRRDYYLEVVAKWEGTHGFGYVVLRPPTVGGGDHIQSIDTSRPWWVDRTGTGAPVTVDLEPAEFATVGIGDLFRVSLESVPTAGEEMARRDCLCSAGTKPADQHAIGCPLRQQLGTD